MVSSFSKDQREKSNYVVQCIEQHCNDLAERFDCFRRIQENLKGGGSLIAEPLTGGLTNYSYRVSSNGVVLFAKLSFPFALWNPDRSAHYDVQRTKNEFVMMKMFAEIAPNNAPFPYFCEPIDDMMVLVTEWCENDEQLARQVSQGCMDPRVCTALGEAMSRLHCLESFDRDFNTNIRETMVSTFDTMQQKLESMHNSTDNNSRATALVQEMGLKECDALVDESRWQYQNSRDCLVHSDLHVKNILVDRMAADNNNNNNNSSSSSSSSSFGGPTGSFAVCDWEMSFAGPVGRDLGSFFPFLLSCLLAQALRGNREASSNLMNAIDLVWEEYSQGLRKGGKSEEFIDYAFRSTLGWCGRFMFLGYFTAGSHIEDMPIDSEADKEILIDSLGVLGISLMRWGFSPSYADASFSSTNLRRLFKATVWAETAFIVSLKAQASGRPIPTPPWKVAVECLRRDSIGSFRNLISMPAGGSSIARLAQ